MSNTNSDRCGMVEEDYSEYEEKYGVDTFEKFSKKKGSSKPSKGKKPRDNFSREQDNF